MKLGIAQVRSTNDLSANLDMISDVLARLPQADLVVFPEYAVLCADNRTMVANARTAGEWISLLAPIAKSHGVAYAVAGLPTLEDNAIYNDFLVLDATGSCLACYHKRHIFPWPSPSASGPDEATLFKPGRQPVALELSGLRLGLTTCFDLRFANVFQDLQGCDAFLCPSAFSTITGPVHWKLLLQARAVEFQSWVVGIGAPAPYYGHSLAATPWGDIAWEASHDKDEIHLLDIDKDIVEETRRRLPMS